MSGGCYVALSRVAGGKHEPIFSLSTRSGHSLKAYPRKCRPRCTPPERLKFPRSRGKTLGSFELEEPSPHNLAGATLSSTCPFNYLSNFPSCVAPPRPDQFQLRLFGDQLRFRCRNYPPVPWDDRSLAAATIHTGGGLVSTS